MTITHMSSALAVKVCPLPVLALVEPHGVVAPGSSGVSHQESGVRPKGYSFSDALDQLQLGSWLLWLALLKISHRSLHALILWMPELGLDAWMGGASWIAAKGWDRFWTRSYLINGYCDYVEDAMSCDIEPC